MTRENRTKQKPCSECGTRTESVTGLCAQHRERAGAKLPIVPCAKCGRSTRSTIGVCSRCQRAKKGTIPPGKVCSGCAAPISKHSKTGMCLPCFNTDRYGFTGVAPEQPDRESPNVLNPKDWAKDHTGIFRYVGDLGKAS